MKEKVRQTILDTAASSTLIQKLDLVDTLQRIGVDYHYKQEIEELLCHVYHNKDDGGSDDLYVTSLRFYLLRKHGYSVSSGKLYLCAVSKSSISNADGFQTYLEGINFSVPDDILKTNVFYVFL